MPRQFDPKYGRTVLLILAGICSILFSIIMIWHPVAGLLALIWITATYAVVFGIMMIALAFRLRGHAKTLAPAPS